MIKKGLDWMAKKKSFDLSQDIKNFFFKIKLELFPFHWKLQNFSNLLF